MARVQIPITRLTRSGVAPAAMVKGNDVLGMYFANNVGNTWLEVYNYDGSDAYLGAEFATSPVDTVPTPDRLATIPAGGTITVGPFPRQWFNNDDNTVAPAPRVGVSDGDNSSVVCPKQFTHHRSTEGVQCRSRLIQQQNGRMTREDTRKS